MKLNVGFNLRLAQEGTMGENCKPLKGFHGAGVIEIIDSDPSGTFRVVYTVKIADRVFVLHAFQKKSKQGIATPKREMDLIAKRFKQALQFKEL